MSDITRRDFLKLGAGFLAGAMIPGYAFAQPEKKCFNFNELSDEEVLARMLFGEVRGEFKKDEDLKEPIMIGFTALNRVERFNYSDLKSAILAPKQYSCFNENNANYHKLKWPGKKDFDSWKKSLKLSEKILKGEYLHLNYGQTHYHKKDMEEYPEWSKSPKMKKIWGQDFFKHHFYEELA